MPVIRLVSSCALRSTSTLSPTRLVWSVNAGVTTDWTFSVLPRPGTRMLMMLLFGVTGLQMLERARPVRPGARTDDVFYQNRGGVAMVVSSAVRLSKISAPFEPMTIEHLIARVTVAGSSFIFVVIYQPGSAAITAAFFDEFRLLLEFLSSFAMPYVSAVQPAARGPHAARRLISCGPPVLT